VLGDLGALAGVLAVSIGLLGASIVMFSGRFGEHVEAAAGVSSSAIRQSGASRAFRPRSAARVLRHKEWTLLRRDPWLMSQTLMQIFYLLPPALMLWRSFGETSALVVAAPVVVMAAGQLAGGLAWLSISGEDAPDLVATAPISGPRITQAKIEAVMGGVALVFAPLIVALAFASLRSAVMTALGVLSAAAAATFIQLCFRVQAKRSLFRRRHTSSRIATIAEAMSSVAWAGTAALAVADTWLAIIPALLAIGILAGVRLVVPKPA
jgi:ABC-2 type transport system permease protein